MNKKYSTYASICTETPEAAILFDRWLDERLDDQEARSAALKEMRDPKSDLPVQDLQKIAAAGDKYNENIEPGQIRILSKRFTEDPDVIPYVAVLEKWGEGMWLVAPFSQYSTPATSGEMTTGIDTYGLRVIQAWNGRTMQDRLLGKSFLFGEMDESLRGQALALFRHEFGGTDLPIGFSALRGPEIIMEADPRRDYLAETIARLRPLSTAVKATERYLADLAMQKIKDSFIRCSFGEQRDKIAAGHEIQMIETHKLGDECEVELVYSPSDKSIRLKIYGTDDELTDACDGYALLDGDGEFLGSFSSGMLKVPAAHILKEFRITDLEGAPVLEVEKN